jgi:hypothetical protein
MGKQISVKVQKQLGMLSQEYACAPDEELDDAAGRPKARRHDRMEESPTLANLGR